MEQGILVIEDNAELAELVAAELRELDYRVDISHDGELGLEKALSVSFDLVILDIVLPGLDGFEICRRLRQQREHVPILILTSKNAEIDRVLGLELGADDYLTKPFSMRELMARVKAILRRVKIETPPDRGLKNELLEHGDIRVNVEGRTVQVAGKPIALTQREFDLLTHFVRNPGKVFNRAELLAAVWGYRYKGYEHTVNSHVNRLRSKIEPDPLHPGIILTVWGVGYKLGETDKGSDSTGNRQKQGIPVSFPNSRNL